MTDELDIKAEQILDAIAGVKDFYRGVMLRLDHKRHGVGRYENS